MTIKVYWTRSVPDYAGLSMIGSSPNEYMSPMRLAEPSPLLKEIDYKEFFGPLVSRCPAIIDDLKNIFVIKSPVSIKLKIYQNRMDTEHQSVEFAKAFFGPPQGKPGIHQLGFGYLFFAEKNLVATQLPAYYSQNDFTDKTFTISGSFDIGQWYRPMAKPAFVFKPDIGSIDIKEGDPLLYIKFNTTEKVQLIEFDDQEFLRLGENSPEYVCGSLKKQATSVMSLEKCYDYFNAFRMRRKILKLIKGNEIK